MSEHSREHEDGATDLLLRAKAGASPSEEDRARVRARLSSAIALGLVGTAGAVATKKGVGILGTLSSLPLFAKIGISVVAVGLASTVAISRYEGAATPPATPTTSAVSAAPPVSLQLPPLVPSASASAPVLAISDLPLAPSAAGALAPSSPPLRLADSANHAPSAPVVVVPDPAATQAPSVALVHDTGEVALLGRMSQSLGRGDAAGALALAFEHERTYPRSAFTEEREGTRAVASCMMLRDDALKQSTSEGFLSRFPHSPMRARVLATCGKKNVQ